MIKKRVAMLAGDGIGSEIAISSKKIMERVSQKIEIDIEFIDAKIGGDAIDHCGNPYPAETKRVCESSDAIFLGAVGGPKWDSVEANMRPEKGLLNLRKDFNVYANLRPVNIYNSLRHRSPLKEEIIGDNLDILIVRELTGGIYFGERGREENKAFDILSYTTMEIERIAKKAFEFARERRKKVTSVDKANVLEASRLWRETVNRVAKNYPDIECEHLYVDNAAMQLIINPKQFDVILTSNMFGDILSDEASVITGSIGMLPSASIGDGISLYEPIHGSAPDIANKNIVNPIASILSCAMMFRHSFGSDKGATIIEEAINSVLEDNIRTKDIADSTSSIIGTSEMTNKIIEAIEKIAI